MPSAGLNRKQPQHAGDRRRDRVGPDQQRLVDRGAADDAVGEHREQQRERQAERRRPARENTAVTLNDVEVGRVVEQVAEVVEPDELRVAAERVLDQQRLPDRLARRPEEEDQRDDDLRRDQQRRAATRSLKMTRFSIGCLVGTTSAARRRRRSAPHRPTGGGSRQARLLSTCWPLRTRAAARCRASPPRRAPAWRSSCPPTRPRAPRRSMSRICTKLPRRRPFEFVGRRLSVSSLTATSRPGFFL